MRSVLRDLLLPFALVLAVTAIVLFYVGRSFDRDALVRAPDSADGVSEAHAGVIEDADEPARSTWHESKAEEQRTVVGETVGEEHAALNEPSPAVSTPSDEEVGLPLSEEQELEGLYGSMSATELALVYETLNTQVQGVAGEAYQARFDAGQYEVQGYGNELACNGQDRNKLVSYQLVPVPGHEAREIRRVELREDEYPEAYALHRRAIWVFDELRRKRHAEEDEDR